METDDLAKKVARYEKLKIQISEMEDEADELKKELQEEMEAGVEYPTPNGKMEVRENTYYQFSDDHKSKKDELKKLEDKEKAQGIATEIKKPVLYYYQNK